MDLRITITDEDTETLEEVTIYQDGSDSEGAAQIVAYLQRTFRTEEGAEDSDEDIKGQREAELLRQLQKTKTKFDAYVTQGDYVLLMRGEQMFKVYIEDDLDTNTEDKSYEAKAIDAWNDDEWRYVGVILAKQCSECGQFKDTVHSLWGIEANMPNLERECADHMLNVANEMIDEYVRTQA